MDIDYKENWPKFHRNKELNEPLTTVEMVFYIKDENDQNAVSRSIKYYLRNWEKVLKDQSRYVGFNWMAFLFGMLWCYYRKLYILGTALIALEYFSIFLIALLSYYVLSILNVDISLVYSLSVISTLILIRILFGFLANHFYLNKTIDNILKVKQRFNTQTDQLGELLIRGGTNIPAIFIGLLIIIILRIFSKVILTP